MHLNAHELCSSRIAPARSCANDGLGEIEVGLLPSIQLIGNSIQRAPVSKDEAFLSFSGEMTFLVNVILPRKKRAFSCHIKEQKKIDILAQKCPRKERGLFCAKKKSRWD